MPSGSKYERHQLAVKLLSESNSYDFIGPYKEFSKQYGKNAKYKNSDLILCHKGTIKSWEVKCHKNDSDWGEISWDQAERLLNEEDMIIIEYSDQGEEILKFSGRSFVANWCYFTKNGRIHYNYKKKNSRVSSNPVTPLKLNNAKSLFQ